MPTLTYTQGYVQVYSDEFWNTATLGHYYRKYIEIEFLKIFYLRKFWTSNEIFSKKPRREVVNI